MSPSDICSKFNLKIEDLPPYIHEILNYNRAETDLVNGTIKNCDWLHLFLGKNNHQQVEVLNKTLLNIFTIAYQIISFKKWQKTSLDKLGNLKENLSVLETKKIWEH